MDFSEEHSHNNVVFTTATILGSLFGTLGSVSLILTSLRSDLHKSMSRHIIFMISLADILQAFPTLVVSSIQLSKISESPDMLSWMSPYACKWQAAIITVGAMLTFLWTLGLSQHIYFLLRFGIKVAHRAFIGLHVLSVIPVAIIAASFYYDVLGIDERRKLGYSLIDENKNHTKINHLTWCWIKVTQNSEHSGPFLKQSCPASMWNGKGFEIFAYIGVTIYCALAWTVYRRIMEDNIINGEGSEVIQGDDASPGSYGSNLQINKILLIPVLFIICRIWGTISRLSCFCFFYDNLCYSPILTTLQNFFDPLQGFANFALFKILSQHSCECNCLTAVRANIQRPQQGASVEPVTVWVDQAESSDSSQFY